MGDRDNQQMSMHAPGWGSILYILHRAMSEEMDLGDQEFAIAQLAFALGKG